MERSIIIKKRVTGLNASVWVNKDDSGQEVLGKKNIQVNLEGGYSFRAFEGSDLFLDVVDYIREGMVVEVACMEIKPAPYVQTQTSESGAEIEIKKYWMNVEDPELIDFSEIVRNEKFASRQKKAEDLVFSHKAGGSRFGKRGKKDEKPVVSNEEDSGAVDY